MRTLVEPPPSSRCGLCGGELLLKQIESTNRTLDLDNEIFVCAKCGREQSYIVNARAAMHRFDRIRCVSDPGTKAQK
jgi:hypothetical protein